MPINPDDGASVDPNIAKQLGKLYRGNSAPESNTYRATRAKLESSFRAEPSARPAPQVNKQPFSENIHSANRLKGYEDKATQARQQARQDFLRTTGQIQEIARGARNPSNFAPKISPTVVVNPPTNTPRPAIPGAGVASGVASLGLGFLVDRYATPYLMNAAQNAGGILSAELNYKLGNISEAELAEALRYVREGNGARWGERVNQIRTIQGLAKRGIKLKNTVPVLPFTGGQLTRVSYTVVLNCIAANGQTIEHQGTGHWGKIGGTVQVVPAGTFVNGDSQWIFNILSQGLTYQAPPKEEQSFHQLRPDGYLRVPRGFEIVSASIARVIREDGQPDVLPTQPLSTTKYVPIVPPANSSTYRQAAPIATPPSTDKPPEENKAKSTVIAIPAGFPISISSEDKTVQLAPSTAAPSTIEIPHPRTTPIEKEEDKKVPPLTISNPGSPDIKLETFGTSSVTINIPGYNPITVNPASNKPQGALPIQDVNRQYQPVANTATPTKPGTTPTTPTTPTTTKPATTEDLDQFKKDLEKLILTGGLLAGLTPAIQTIGDRVNQTARQTTPEALETAAAAGTCRTTQPGGCTTRALDDAVNRVNQNTNQRANGLDGANALANAAQIAQLNDITNRIGAQLPGGLAGASTRLSKFLGIDRIFNLLNFLAILHNAMMLSNGLKVTLLQTLSSVGNATGLLQTSENENVDLNQVFNQGVEQFFVSVFGIETVAEFELAWKKYNRIYQAGANVMNAVSSMTNALADAIETTAEYTGKIGNALKGAGVIAENAYQWFSEKVNAKNSKFMTFNSTVNNVTTVLNLVNEVAETVIEGQEGYTEAVKATQEFRKELADAKKSEGIQNKLIAEQAAKIKENSTKDPTGSDDEGLLSFLTDR